MDKLLQHDDFSKLFRSRGFLAVTRVGNSIFDLGMLSAVRWVGFSACRATRCRILSIYRRVPLPNGHAGPPTPLSKHKPPRSELTFVDLPFIRKCRRGAFCVQWLGFSTSQPQPCRLGGAATSRPTPTMSSCSRTAGSWIRGGAGCHLRANMRAWARIHAYSQSPSGLLTHFGQAVFVNLHSCATNGRCIVAFPTPGAQPDP